MTDLPPISRRLKVEDGTTVSPRAKAFKTVGKAQPLGDMQSVFKPVRCTSSTTTSRLGDSETESDDGPTGYGQVDPSLSGRDRHMILMLEDTDISTADSDRYFNEYFSGRS
jgi:hypothetical protein